jgi:hypothetical protein
MPPIAIYRGDFPGDTLSGCCRFGFAKTICFASLSGSIYPICFADSLPARFGVVSWIYHDEAVLSANLWPGALRQRSARA